MNKWQKPEFVEIRMNAEIGGYQPDDQDGPDGSELATLPPPPAAVEQQPTGHDEKGRLAHVA